MGAYFITFVLVVAVTFLAAALYSNVRRTAILEARAQQLSEQLMIISRTLGELIRGQSAEQRPTQQPEVRPATTPVAPLAPPSPVQEAQSRVRAYTAGATGPAPTIVPSPPVRPSRTKQEWEALIGEKLLNRIGAVALVIGAAFFLKYAFDRELIPPIVRVLMGVTAGAVLVAVASQKRTTLPIFSQGLLGAGLSLLYLSAYASFNFYQLVPHTVALALLAIVTALTLERALTFDSLPVAVLGLIGGFLTPVLLSDGQGGGGGLFLYIGLLDLGLILMVARRDRWWVLEPLALAATYVIFFASEAAEFRPESFTQIFLFVTAVWLMFYLVDLDRARRGVETFINPRRISAAANAALYYAAAAGAFHESHPRLLSLVTLSIGLAYLVPILILKKSLARYTLKAIVLIATATALELSGLLLVVVWSVEALVAIAAGLQFGLRHSRLAGLGLFAVTTVKLFATEGAIEFSALSPDRFTPLMNVRALTFIALAMSAATAGFAYRNFAVEERDWAAPSLHYLWGTLGFVLVGIETHDTFDRLAIGRPELSGLRFTEVMVMVLMWGVYSIGLAQLGVTERIPSILHVAIAVFVIAVLVGLARGASFSPPEEFTLILNARFAIFLLLVGFSAIHVLIVRSHPDPEWSKGTAIVMQSAAALVLFVLATAEARDYFEHRLAIESRRGALQADLDQLRNMKQLSISAVWMLYSAIGMAIGIYRRSRTVRLTAIAIFGLAILKVFLYDLSFLDQLYRIFSFIGLGLILLGASYAYTRYRDIILGTAPGQEQVMQRP